MLSKLGGTDAHFHFFKYPPKIHSSGRTVLILETFVLSEVEGTWTQVNVKNVQKLSVALLLTIHILNENIIFENRSYLFVGSTLIEYGNFPRDGAPASTVKKKNSSGIFAYMQVLMVTYIYYKNVHKHLQILTLICGYVRIFWANRRKRTFFYALAFALSIGKFLYLFHVLPTKRCSTFAKFMHKRLVSLCLFSMYLVIKKQMKPASRDSYHHSRSYLDDYINVEIMTLQKFTLLSSERSWVLWCMYLWRSMYLWLPTINQTHIYIHVCNHNRKL